VGYRLRITFGDVELEHDDDDDPGTAMEKGTYSTALRWLSAQFTQLVESGLFNEPDVDEEVERLAEKLAAEEAPPEDKA
jgi:hypothetical protein